MVSRVINRNRIVTGAEGLGNRLLYGLCMRCTCVKRAKRVRNDKVSSTFMQRPNAGERNMPSLAADLISGSRSSENTSSNRRSN